MTQALFAALGFRWDRSTIPDLPAYSVKRATWRFHRMLPEFVWDASMLEGNPFTFPEVQTLLDGVTVGGHKLADQNQVLNLAESSKRLLAVVRDGSFRIDKPMFCALQAIVAKEEALEWGIFRGEGTEITNVDVALGEHGRYHPLPTIKGAAELNRVFEAGRKALDALSNPFEKGAAFFLFGALQQFFFDGNKRTSRFMMNGCLMSGGVDAISVPAKAAQQFNEKMVRFYLSRDGTGMMEFLLNCHPEYRPQPSHDAPKGFSP
jgi:Fic family protein